MSSTRCRKHKKLVLDKKLLRAIKHIDKMYKYDEYKDASGNFNPLPKYSGTKYRGRNRYEAMMFKRFHTSVLVRSMD